MAVASVASHGGRHVNPLVEQQLERQHGTNASGRQNEGNGAVGEDTFTPSSESDSAQATAQAAGIFQLTQAAPAANTPPAQPPSNAGQNLPSSQNAPVGADTVDSAPTIGAADAGAAATAGQQIAGAPAAQAATTAGPSNVDVQGQVQALNLALAALGLSHYDIQQIDRIATVIQNFNPSAYTDLVNQFQRQAQQAKQLTTPPPANIGTEANPPAAANSGTSAAANADVAGQQGPAANNPPLGGQTQAPQQSSDTVTANQQNPRPQNAAA